MAANVAATDTRAVRNVNVLTLHPKVVVRSSHRSFDPNGQICEEPRGDKMARDARFGTQVELLCVICQCNPLHTKFLRGFAWYVNSAEGRSLRERYIDSHVPQRTNCRPHRLPNTIHTSAVANKRRIKDPPYRGEKSRSTPSPAWTFASRLPGVPSSRTNSMNGLNWNLEPVGSHRPLAGE